MVTKKQLARKSSTPAKSTKKSLRTKNSNKFKKKLRQRLVVFLQVTKKSYKNFLQRRPHRSFRKTNRRDYVRSLKLPSYLNFTANVFSILWQRKWLFIGMSLFYGILSAIFGGLTSQTTYNEIANSLGDASQDIFGGGVWKIGEAGLLTVAALTGGASQMSDSQQVYYVLVLLLTWLATVWLLRSILAGGKPKLRDALYNSGAPVVSTFLVVLVLFVQLLPIGILGLIYSGLQAVGQLEQGFSMVLFSAMAILLVSLSFYMITSTLIALVIVTIPGMYPVAALKAAGDIVVGRRLRILLRFLWLIAMIGLFWLAVMIPVILLVNWLNETWVWVSILPIVPAVAAIVGSITVIWSASYVYLLYRKVVDDDASPA